MSKAIIGILAFTALCSFALRKGEVARTSFKHPEDKGLLKASLKAGDKLTIWFETQMEYEGDLQLGFDVDVLRDGKKIESFQMDALHTNPTLNSTSVVLGKRSKLKYTGRMKKMKIDKDGHYQFDLVFKASPNETLQLPKADVFLKVK